MNFINNFLLLLLFISLTGLSVDKPNILWITAEDMSPVLGCYGDKNAITPHIDSLAEKSVLFTHAFATAPVCSPSRSCIINGLPASSQGTHNMRSAFPIPKTMNGFPSILRNMGYFTSNNVKTDYNSANWKQIIKASWTSQGASAHWRERKANQPFFSVFNLMTSHQSRSMVCSYDDFKKKVQSKLKPEEIHSPKTITLPPYYPDTPLIRKTQARFYDCVTAMDKEVGDILKQLQEDNLHEDTIVFFYSDHGSGMPRHKRALLDSGMRIAMLVHVPQKWQHLVPAEAGSSSSQLINFADLAPSILNIVNAPKPDHMEGLAFLGKNLDDEHNFLVGHRDRVDEVIDMARSVRTKDFLYIRNFMPHHSYNQPTSWPDSGAIRHDFYRAAKGKLSPAQAHFMGPTRAIEELYDCKNDPMNLKNLALDKKYKSKLIMMRSILREQVIARKDLGFLPEALQWELSEGRTPYEMSRKDYAISSIFAAADQVGRNNTQRTLDNLKDRNPAIRYWAAVDLSTYKNLTEEASKQLEQCLEDSSINVRIQSAYAILKQNKSKAASQTLAHALENNNFSAVLHAARTIENLGHRASHLKQAVTKCDHKMKSLLPENPNPVIVLSGRIDLANFISFSTSSFLNLMNITKE